MYKDWRGLCDPGELPNRTYLLHYTHSCVQCLFTSAFVSLSVYKQQREILRQVTVMQRLMDATREMLLVPSVGIYEWSESEFYE